MIYCTVYNGGVSSYTAAEELYKLIRDVGVLKPDLVISFSGLNNIRAGKFPYVPWYLNTIFEAVFPKGYCRGIWDEEMSLAEIWEQQERMMNAICSVYGAEFICFAQPVYSSKNELTFNERLQFVPNSSFRRAVSQIAKQFDWMVDIQSLLDDNPEVFMDSAHVYEVGNQIITDAIYNWIDALVK